MPTNRSGCDRSACSLVIGMPDVSEATITSGADQRIERAGRALALISIFSGTFSMTRPAPSTVAARSSQNVTSACRRRAARRRRAGRARHRRAISGRAPAPWRPAARHAPAPRCRRATASPRCPGPSSPRPISAAFSIPVFPSGAGSGAAAQELVGEDASAAGALFSTPWSDRILRVCCPLRPWSSSRGHAPWCRRW